MTVTNIFFFKQFKSPLLVLIDIKEVSSLKCFFRFCCSFFSFLLLVLSVAGGHPFHQVKIRRLTHPLQNIALGHLQKVQGCFSVCFGSLAICSLKGCQINFLLWCESELTVYPCTLFCYIINKHKWLSAIGSDACQYHHSLPSCVLQVIYTLCHELLQAFS